MRSSMPRRHTVSQTEFPYHVGARSINREWFSLPMEVVWQIFCDQLYFVHHAYRVQILSFVLMSNHFHMIIRTPEGNLSDSMGWFMRETSRQLTRCGNRINQAYGGRYFRAVIDSPLYYLHAYKYIYLNPVRARLSDRAENYPYSTLSGLLGRRLLSIPIEQDETLFGDVRGTLQWLNQIPSEENWDAVSHAMYKSKFQLRMKQQKPHPLENNML